MTERDALQSVFSTFQQSRFIHSGAPQEIELQDAEGKTLAKLPIGYWSKSAVNNNSQVVFLILAETDADSHLPNATRIQHGAEIWVIQPDRKSPAETQKAYWQLPVKPGGTDGRRNKS